MERNLRKTDWFYVQGSFPKRISIFSIFGNGGAILIEPPKKIGKTFYECGKHFKLDQIIEMYKEDEVSGIVFINGKMFEIYNLIKTGNHIEFKRVKKENVSLSKKHNKGGQSQQRFARKRLESIHNYITKVSENVIRCFVKNNGNSCSINKLIIAGPGEKRNLLAKNESMLQYFSDKIKVIKTGELNDKEILLTLNNSGMFFDEENFQKEEKAIDEIRDLMLNNDEKLFFGLKEVTEGLNNFMVQKIIMSNEINIDIGEEYLRNVEIILVNKHKMNLIGMDIMAIKWY